MEPLVARRKLSDDIGKVAQRLATYQLALGKKDRRADLIVYSLDLPKGDLSLVASALEPTEARLVDASVAREKRQLIERVQEVGSTLLLGT
jgi:hypothetical protein